MGVIRKEREGVKLRPWEGARGREVARDENVGWCVLATIPT